eukprot:m.32954 g.32954  ORF g.32954 m.32954 type:complete len:470 (+) comp9564_c0_seq1:328-1737(+)
MGEPDTSYLGNVSGVTPKSQPTTPFRKPKRKSFRLDGRSVVEETTGSKLSAEPLPEQAHLPTFQHAQSPVELSALSVTKAAFAPKPEGEVAPVKEPEAALVTVTPQAGNIIKRGILKERKKKGSMFRGAKWQKRFVAVIDCGVMISKEQEKAPHLRIVMTNATTVDIQTGERNHIIIQPPNGRQIVLEASNAPDAQSWFSAVQTAKYNFKEWYKHRDLQEVLLHKAPGVPLGGTLIGGADTVPMEPITLKQIKPKGLLDTSGMFKEGDIFVEVAGVNLESLTHADAIKTISEVSGDVTIRLMRVDEDAVAAAAKEAEEASSTESSPSKSQAPQQQAAPALAPAPVNVEQSVPQTEQTKVEAPKPETSKVEQQPPPQETKPAPSTEPATPPAAETTPAAEPATPPAAEPAKPSPTESTPAPASSQADEDAEKQARREKLRRMSELRKKRKANAADELLAVLREIDELPED